MNMKPLLPVILLLSALATFSDRAFAQVAPASATGPNEKHETVQLTPFEVVAGKNDSYEALNFSSLSGTNKSLDKLPVTAEVMNSTMMADVGTTDVKDLLYNYATAVTPGENGAGSSTAEGRSAGDRFTLFQLGIRGLSSGVPRRNGFLDWGYLSEGFSVERMEIIRGPQALLYGATPPGGVTNMMTKKAVYGRRFYEVQGQVDSEGAQRYQLDANIAGTLLGRRAAVRLAGFYGDIKFWRTNVSRDTTGQYGEAAIELFPATKTTLRVEVENLMDLAVEPSGRPLVTGIPTRVANNTPLPLLLARHDPALAAIADGMITWDNVMSLKGNSNATMRHLQNFTVTGSSQLASWLHGQITASEAPRWTRRVNAVNFTPLTAPRTSGNPLDTWAVAYRPQIAPIVTMEPKGVRGLLTADFSVTRYTRNNLVFGADRILTNNDQWTYDYYQLDAAGKFIVSPSATLVNTNERGRTLMPVQWVDVTKNLPGYVALTRDEYVVNGQTYRLQRQKDPGVVAATAANPMGLNGGNSGVSVSDSAATGTFAALFTTWFAGKVDTLLGARYDWVTSRTTSAGTVTSGDDYSGNAGVVWNVTKPVALYASYSRNFQPGSNTGVLHISGQPLPNGVGIGREAGLKLNAFDGRLSGSLTYYKTTSHNQSAFVDSVLLNATDPSGINGNFYTFTRPSINYDVATHGIEASVTARPAKEWRVQLGLSHNIGREGSSVYIPFLYNDEFRTNAQGQVTLTDGTPLLVPVSTSTPVARDGRTYAAGTATEPLTVSILKSGDQNGNYKANMSADNGKILNAAALGLTVPGVATGRVGLPIAEHQLGFRPGAGESLLAKAGGDRTSGYPRDALTLTTMYTRGSGILKGAGIGLNASFTRDTQLYYYVDQADKNARKAFFGPDRVLLNVIASYQFKVTERLRWKTQININNVLDRKDITVFPNAATGAPDNAAYRTDPLRWVWTNTVSF